MRGLFACGVQSDVRCEWVDVVVVWSQHCLAGRVVEVGELPFNHGNDCLMLKIQTVLFGGVDGEDVCGG